MEIEFIVSVAVIVAFVVVVWWTDPTRPRRRDRRARSRWYTRPPS